ncbi:MULTISPECIES: CcoQ/FixQ family Cbb3-type cytochrome c oxidase assembly chaperone [Falsihalocynthiibacter]|uniref:Cytochrome oxidase n=1 Tax=Falsihalocynthiibacter arcticus TaxID=1579316 RepID=A0A126V0V9_9RHOB|nr:CcoQ/FixQ family Cbb3-type cytochrome c oxidase assembly chaperone [Falsihalocynthiibacter arcticus]AML51319.1 cytochrome oxidase [Falsihalocynthiibacter arcticus]
MYTFLRQLADSWVLLLMFAFFLGVFLWVFRPGSKKIYKETANIPFEHEDHPAPDVAPKASKAPRDESEEA